MDSTARPCLIAEPDVTANPADLVGTETRSGPRCRFCDSGLRFTLVDLGMSPLCESYVASERLNRAETFYPLRVYVCDRCFLAQLEEYVAAEEIFTEYAYFSSYSDSWVEHARQYAGMVAKRFGLGRSELGHRVGEQ